VYIGKASVLERRKISHKHNAKYGNSRFYAAIRKHGFHSIEWTVLEELADESAAYEAEIRHILALKSHDKDNGYNMLVESSVAKSRAVVRSDGREYDSVQAAAEENGCNYANISIAASSGNFACGYKWFYKSDPKPDRLGARSDRYKKRRGVVRSDGKMYANTAMAAQDVGMSYKTIHQAIRRGSKAGGYYWKYKGVLSG
jgi:hypothetical protein